MRSTLFAFMLLGLFLATTATTTGCRQSTRADVGDDEVGVETSGPYAADAKEVTAEIVTQMKRQQVLETFKAKHGEPPIVTLITAINDTRFPEVTKFFEEDMEVALRHEFTREGIRFVVRDAQAQEEIAREREGKRSGEVTDRTGPRTRLGADFFLRAEFTTLSMTDGHTEDDTVKYSYELIDAENGESLFKGAHDIRRVSDTPAVYR